MLSYSLISIIVAHYGIIAEWASKIGCKSIKTGLQVIAGASNDIRSSVLLENLIINWKSLEERRKYLKSISIYKILSGHNAPNLKDFFALIMKGIILTISEIEKLI